MASAMPSWSAMARLSSRSSRTRFVETAGAWPTRWGGLVCLQEPVAAVADLRRDHHTGERTAAVEAEPVVRQDMRVIHAAEFAVLGGRRVAMHDQCAFEAALPVEEAARDPGPARVDARRPRTLQERVAVATAGEAAMHEQRIA